MNILTFIGSFGWLGNIGYFYANMLFKLFGYLGYICFFLLAYLCHKMPHPLRRDQSSLEKSLGIILITISILTLQSLFISDSGVFGTAFNNILSPIISDLGVFILSSAILLFGILLYLEKDFIEFFTFLQKKVFMQIKKDWNNLIKTFKTLNFNTLNSIFQKQSNKKNTPKPLTLEELINKSTQKQKPISTPLQELSEESSQKINEESTQDENITEKENQQETILDLSNTDKMAQDSQILEKESLEIKLVPLKDSQKPVSNFIPINPQDTIHRLKKIEEALHERRSKDTSDDLKLIPKTKLQEEQKYQIEASQTFYQYESFTQPHEEQKNIKPIKSYPKDLYSPKPFSSYLENEPQEPTPAINEDSTLPNTIFYYTKKDTQTTQKTLEDESKDNLQEADLNPNEDIISPSQENGEISPSNAYAKPIEPQQEEPQSSATIHYYTNFNSPIQQEIPFYGFPAYHESIHESTTAKTQPPTQNISPIQDIQSTQTTTQISHEIPALSNTSYAQQTPNLSQDSNMYIPTTPKSSVQTQVKILEENQKLLKEIEYDPNHKHKGQNFILPKLEFLQLPQEERIEINEEEIDKKINDLLGKLRMFKIEGDIVRTYSGPIVTTFEFRPSPNVKVSRILTLQDDLAMALRAKTIRIQAPIPGKDVVGIEIPNHQIQTIYLREILENNLFQNSTSPLTLALGKDIVGNPFITDLKKLPHLLIAGTTGSGKSVGINAMILSLLYKNTPDQLKLIMIDPKMLEFSIYNDIPHLLTPVITQPKKAIIALDNTVKEMERRYTLMSEVRTKNIEGYNQKALNEGFEPFPYIVVIIDELADLMMSGGKEAELSISRLAQMARASGIHLIVATQRPSVDVVTGIIKANLPSRISYKVGQKIDSKVILDSFGAESLLGRGDMLFTPPSGGIVRLHAPWSTEHEIEEIVNFIKSQGSTNYDENFMPSEDENLGMRYEVETDELYEEAKRIILNDRKTSISYIQRRLGIGYNKAANIIEQMQTKGFLSEPNPKGVREILGE